MPPVENPTASDTSSNEPDVMSLALAADAGETITATPAATPAPASQETSPSAASDENAPTDSQATAKTQPEANAADKPAEPAKPTTPFEKAKRERARQESLLKNFEVEKAQVRAEAERIKGHHTELEQLRREVQTLRQPPKPAADAAGISAETYDQLAENYANDGNPEMAKLARERAGTLRQQAARAPQAAAPVDTWQTPDFQREWERNVQEITTADPTLNDPKNPVFQSVNTLVNHPQWSPFFRANPAGIKAAVEVARLMASAANVPALQKQIEGHKAEIARLNQLNQPRGGGMTTQPSGPKPITQMSDEDASDEIRRMAALADREG